ncbi:uncharacterized protein A4U43_UnF5390 [Asparagus officinalis]|uniref:Uncharacterized protein n=1 Tax=Asparagus officinalis TaxID=4686 RepID=A0A1R3L6Q2_ASPOF|nr:uncharacterized protein A4U43_UnF5390 [Asparagus officinalis]
MAITYGDFYPKKFKNTDVSSGVAIFLVVFSILCGLIAFILCLAAEGSRSEVTRLLTSTPSSKDNSCYYSNSGKKPLACAIAAFVLLAIAMFSEHGYMLIAVANPQPPVLVAWATPQDPIAAATIPQIT